MIFLEKLWNGRERRAHPRVPTDRSVSLRVGRTWQACRIADISDGGVAFLSELRPAVGKEVVVRIDGLGLFKCRVLRHGAEGFAAEFEAADFVEDVPTAADPEQPELPFPPA